MQAYCIAGFISYHPSARFSFALPLFRCRESLFYIQEIDEVSGDVIAFRTITIARSDVVTLSSSREVAPGDRAIYVFVQDGVPEVGDLQELEPTFRKFTDKHKEEIAVILQISELSGASVTRREARFKMSRLIYSTSGPDAEHMFYSVSTSRQVLWGIVAKNCKKEDTGTALTELRKLIFGRLQPMSAELLDAEDWAAVEPLLIVNRHAIIKEFEEEFRVPAEPKTDPYVFAFTPDHDSIRLPRGATMIDFAYAIHSEIGDGAVGAKANGRVVPLRTRVADGDVIQILCSRAQHPQPAWLSYVKTRQARYRVRRFVKSLAAAEAAKPER